MLLAGGRVTVVVVWDVLPATVVTGVAAVAVAVSVAVIKEVTVVGAFLQEANSPPAPATSRARKLRRVHALVISRPLGC